MFYVYILYSEKFGKTYTGFTSDLEQRFLSHNVLSNKDWTKRYRPWVLIYSEEYSTKGEAVAREKFLKTGKGREFVRAKVEEYLTKSL
jgi:putative endonuclease